jgi:CubicO group peptidase (beta-lactamase class C family)
MDTASLEQRLQSELEELVSNNDDVYSAVLGVSHTTRDFEWAGASGMAYPDRPDRMQVDTPIFMASITKMYTGAVAMILEERGSLSLNDPLAKFLPAPMLEGLHRYKGRDYSDHLAVYHLVSQTSGLPDYFEESPKGGKSVFDQIVELGDMEWSVEDVVHIAKSRLSPKFPPEPKDKVGSGNKAYYSDTNYQLLGAVIESVAQKPLQEVFSEFVIEPIGLSSTYLYDHRNPKATLPASIHYKTKPLIIDKAMTSFGPDGGMVSNVEDSLKFLGQFMEGKLFSNASTLQRMQNWKGIFFPFQYGLGLMRFKLPRILSPFSATPELIGHSGASSAFLFQSDIGQLYVGGTLNQLDNRRRPINLMLKVVKIVDEALRKT